MNLWPFQAKAVADIEVAWAAGTRRVMLVLPTGTGKTVVASDVMRRLQDQGARVLFLCHRTELIIQTAEKLSRVGLRCGFIKAGMESAESLPIQVGSIQTYKRRLKQLGHMGFTHLIMDEVQRDEYSAAEEAHPDIPILGLTATPYRQSNEAHNRLMNAYDQMIVGIGYKAAISGGFIVRERCFAPDVPDLRGVAIRAGDYDAAELEEAINKKELIGSIVSHWLRLADATSTITFAATIKHAHQINDEFRSAGVRSAVIHGETPKDERASLVAQHSAGTLKNIVNVGVFIEGFDAPATRCIVMARPTQSLTAYMQMAGRGCRASPGKLNYLLLDHAGNIFRHGSPSIDRPWKLEKRAKRQTEQFDAPEVTHCKRCYYIYSGGGSCPQCNYEASPSYKPVRSHRGELTEMAEDFPPPAPESLISGYEKERRRQFAIASARGKRGPALIQHVREQMARSFSINLKGSRQILPMESWLLW